MLCALTRFIMHFKKKHPEKDATVIDYGIAITMLPTVLFGSFVGNYINLTFPSIIIQTLLTIVLVLMTIETIFKARALYRKETALK
jgi:uncharacterized membrane protein YfcA